MVPCCLGISLIYKLHTEVFGRCVQNVCKFFPRSLWCGGRYVAADCSGKGFYCAHFLLWRSRTVLRLSLSAESPRTHSAKILRFRPSALPAAEFSTKCVFSLSTRVRKSPASISSRVCHNQRVFKAATLTFTFTFLEINNKQKPGEICLRAIQGVRCVDSQWSR